MTCHDQLGWVIISSIWLGPILSLLLTSPSSPFFSSYFFSGKTSETKTILFFVLHNFSISYFLKNMVPFSLYYCQTGELSSLSVSFSVFFLLCSLKFSFESYLIFAKWISGKSKMDEEKKIHKPKFSKNKKDPCAQTCSLFNQDMLIIANMKKQEPKLFCIFFKKIK